MTHASKSKQTKTKSTPSLTTRSKAKSTANILDEAINNTSHKNTKLWKQWKVINNFAPSIDFIIAETILIVEIDNLTLMTQDLQILNTWLWILDNYIINKWENLDNFLDNKIKNFIIIFINYFKFFIKILFNILNKYYNIIIININYLFNIINLNNNIL